ncbi:MAG TPA: heavy-metal-associated domain-containing protein [Pyrinomonadaceae bacterium]|nr:heavy-metal-associated domain-containing protein [Pyrinomonadaceae bacterium]
MTKRVSSLGLIAILLVFTAASALAATKTTTIHVKGMHCKMCSASVTKALKAVDGVQNVDVSWEKGTAIVDYDDQKVTEERLREVVNSTGFQVVDEKTE